MEATDRHRDMPPPPSPSPTSLLLAADWCCPPLDEWSKAVLASCSRATNALQEHKSNYDLEGYSVSRLLRQFVAAMHATLRNSHPCV